jgi:hypothetical protein
MRCLQASGSSSSSKKAMPVVTASRQQQQRPSGGAMPIPDFMKIPLSEREKQLGAFKSQLLSVLQPTPDTVQAVASNTTLMAGVCGWVGGWVGLPAHAASERRHGVARRLPRTTTLPWLPHVCTHPPRRL